MYSVPKGEWGGAVWQWQTLPQGNSTKPTAAETDRKALHIRNRDSVPLEKSSLVPRWETHYIFLFYLYKKVCPKGL